MLKALVGSAGAKLAGMGGGMSGGGKTRQLGGAAFRSAAGALKASPWSAQWLGRGRARAAGPQVQDHYLGRARLLYHGDPSNCFLNMYSTLTNWVWEQPLI